jgi:hypothetical protein
MDRYIYIYIDVWYGVVDLSVVVCDKIDSNQRTTRRTGRDIESLVKTPHYGVSLS